jgi:hypothetical protein
MEDRATKAPLFSQPLSNPNFCHDECPYPIADFDIDANFCPTQVAILARSRQKMRNAARATLAVVGCLLLSLYCGSAYSKLPSTQGQPIDNDILKFNSQECLHETGKQAIVFVSRQGGYYLPPSNAIRYEDALIPYYWKGSQISMPSRTEVERQMAMYVTKNIGDCAFFKNLMEQGYEIHHGCTALSELDNHRYLRRELQKASYRAEKSNSKRFEPCVVSSMRKGDVAFSITSSFEVKSPTSAYTVSSASASVPINLRRVYDLVAEYMTFQKDAGDWVLLGRLTKHGYDNNFFPELIQIDKQRVVARFHFEIDAVNKANKLIYAFASEYNW